MVSFLYVRYFKNNCFSGLQSAKTPGAVFELIIAPDFRYLLALVGEGLASLR
jgi:hypothetical protein